MMCFWTAAIGYIPEEIQIDLNVRFRDQRMRWELCNLSLNMARSQVSCNIGYVWYFA